MRDIAASINDEAGKKIAFTGADNPGEGIEPLPTGIAALDLALGIGGLPKGRVCEIYGLPGSAKTSLALHIISQCQKKDIACAFVDAEHALDLSLAAAIGVDVDNLLIIQPDCGEEALETVEQLIRNKTVGFVAIDSVSALVPKGEVEAEVGKTTIGAQARLISTALRKLVPPLAKSGAIVLFINQVRVNIMGGQYDPHTTPGGMALRFYKSVSLELKKYQGIKLGGEMVGMSIRVIVRKNKVHRPVDPFEIRFFFDRGFESEIDVVAAAEARGLITRQGNTYWYGEHKLALGKEKSNVFLNEHPELKASLLSELQLEPSQSSETS